MEEQIMKEAVEVSVIVSDNMSTVAFGLLGTNLKKGDKIIKKLNNYTIIRAYTIILITLTSL